MATRVPRTRAARDITRLQSEFEKQMREMNERQAKAFSEYTAATSATMAPYEAQMASYTGTLLPEYERQVRDYNEALKAYQEQVKAELGKTVDYGAPAQYREVTSVATPVTGVAQTTPYVYDPANPFNFPVLTQPVFTDSSSFMGPGFVNAPIMGGPTEGTTFEEVPIFDVPKFTRTAPVMPEAPTAPKVQAFDTSKFEAEAAQLQERLQRELSARRGSRLAAVRRQPRAGLMAGA